MSVKEIREALGLTRTEFAVKFGVAEITIRRWETGEQKIHEVNRRQLERLERKVRKMQETGVIDGKATDRNDIR